MAFINGLCISSSSALPSVADGGLSVRRYLTDAIFPFYIVHQTAIIMIAHQLHGWDLPAWLEAGIVIFRHIGGLRAEPTR